MKEHKVKVLVRLCDKSYDDKLIKEAGIEVRVSPYFITDPDLPTLILSHHR